MRTCIHGRLQSTSAQEQLTPLPFMDLFRGWETLEWQVGDPYSLQALRTFIPRRPRRAASKPSQLSNCSNVLPSQATRQASNDPRPLSMLFSFICSSKASHCPILSERIRQARQARQAQIAYHPTRSPAGPPWRWHWFWSDSGLRTPTPVSRLHLDILSP